MHRAERIPTSSMPRPGIQQLARLRNKLRSNKRVEVGVEEKPLTFNNLANGHREGVRLTRSSEFENN